MPIYAEKWQWTMLHFQEVPWLPRILQDWHHKQPTPSTKQWICWTFGGYLKEAYGIVWQGWKTVELWPTWVQSDTHIRKPSITSRGSHMMQAENLTSPDSIQCLEICGKFQNLSGTDLKTVKYFKSLFYGTWARTACFHERSTWKCMENGCDQPTSKGTWIILD